MSFKNKQFYFTDFTSLHSDHIANPCIDYEINNIYEIDNQAGRGNEFHNTGLK